MLVCADDPARLFDLFSKGFGLPVAWPLSHQGFYTSGGIAFGNIHVEVIRFGSPTGMANTRYFGLAFEPVSLDSALDEVARRGIPHGPPTSFAGADGVGWTNVVLGGLLGRRSSTFTLGRRLGGNSFLNHWIGRQATRLIRSAWGGWIVGRSLVEPMIFLVEYQAAEAAAWRAGVDSGDESGRSGLLGIEAVDQIEIGVKDIEASCRRWQDLLEPELQFSPGVWKWGNSPTIRLVQDTSYRIRSMTLRVASLKRAEDGLRVLGLLHSAKDDCLRIDPDRIDGLEITLK